MITYPAKTIFATFSVMEIFFLISLLSRQQEFPLLFYRRLLLLAISRKKSIIFRLNHLKFLLKIRYCKKVVQSKKQKKMLQIRGGASNAWVSFSNVECKVGFQGQTFSLCHSILFPFFYLVPTSKWQWFSFSLFSFWGGMAACKLNKKRVFFSCLATPRSCEKISYS